MTDEPEGRVLSLCLVLSYLTVSRIFAVTAQFIHLIMVSQTNVVFRFSVNMDLI